MKFYGDLTGGTGDVHARYFYGDGSKLINISGAAVNHASLSSLDYASSGHTGFMPTTGGTFVGDVFVGANTISGTGDVYAGNFYGDGSNLIGVVASISGSDHSTLSNLDYASAGHTGFIPTISGTDIQNQLNTKMPLAGGTFTGDVTWANGIDILAAASGTNDIGTAALPFGNIYCDGVYTATPTQVGGIGMGVTDMDFFVGPSGQFKFHSETTNIDGTGAEDIITVSNINSQRPHIGYRYEGFADPTAPDTADISSLGDKITFWDSPFFKVAMGVGLYSLWFQASGAAGTPAIRFFTAKDDNAPVERLTIQDDGNIGFFGATTFGFSAAKTMAIANGTAPVADINNQFAFYAADLAVDNAGPHFRTENGTVIALDQSLKTSDSPQFVGLTLTGNLTMPDGGTIGLTDALITFDGSNKDIVLDAGADGKLTVGKTGWNNYEGVVIEKAAYPMLQLDLTDNTSSTFLQFTESGTPICQFGGGGTSHASIAGRFVLASQVSGKGVDIITTNNSGGAKTIARFTGDAGTQRGLNVGAGIAGAGPPTTVAAHSGVEGLINIYSDDHSAFLVDTAAAKLGGFILASAGTHKWLILNAGTYSVPNDRLSIYNAASAEIFTMDQNGNVGIGTPTPLYDLDVRGTDTASQLHFASSDVDSGGYLTSGGTANFYMSAGVAYVAGTGWVAKHTDSNVLGGTDNDFFWYLNSGLTPGNTITLKEVMHLAENGVSRLSIKSYGTDYSEIFLQNDNSGFTSTDGVKLAFRDDNICYLWSYESTGTMYIGGALENISFWTLGDEVMKIHDSGGVSIGDAFVATDPGVDNVIIEGNVGIGATTFGTDAVGTMAIANGTAPTADVNNQFAFYSADIAAGNAAPHFRTENGTVIALDQSLKTSDSPQFDGLTLTGDILNTISGTNDLGTSALPFGNIYCDDLYTAGNSVHIGNSEITSSGTTTTISLKDGNVGIGIVIPTNPLTVYGSGTVVQKNTHATSETNTTVTTLLNLAKTATSMTDGFGAVNVFAIEDEVGETSSIGYLGVIRDGLADDSGKMIFATYSAGSDNVNMVIDKDGQVGMGTTYPLYDLDVRGTDVASQLHFSADGVNDNGGYLTSGGTANFYMSAGVAHDGTNWRAKHTSCNVMGGADNGFHWYLDSGITIGNTVALTEVLTMDQPNNANTRLALKSYGTDNSEFFCQNDGSGFTSTDGLRVSFTDLNHAYFWNFETTGNCYIGGAMDDISFYTNGDEIVRFHESGGVSIGDGYVATDPGVDNVIIEGNVGVGISGPDGTLHVHTATCGTWAPHVNADDLAIENGTSGGISIATPDTSVQSIFFSCPARTGTYTAGIEGRYNAGTDFLAFHTQGNANTMFLQSGNVTIGGNVVPDGTLHVHTATAGTWAPHADGDDFVIENSAIAGLSIASPDANSQRILFSCPTRTGDYVARIDADYNGGTDYLRFGTNGSANTMFLQSGNVMIGGATAPDGTLHVHSATAGTWAPSANADDLIVENSTHGGISIAGPDANSQAIHFSCPTRTGGYHSVIDTFYNSGTPYIHMGTVGFPTTVKLIGGDVGIGHPAPTPDGTLHVHTATAGTWAPHGGADDLSVENGTSGGISIATPDASVQSIFFSCPTRTGTYTGGIEARYNAGADFLSFHTQGNANTMKIQGGVVQATGGIQPNGNAITASETLDDYEEGTWTPSLGGTTTYTIRVGKYTKIGRQVRAWMHLTINNIGTGNAAQVSGLPFTSMNLQIQHGFVSKFTNIVTNSYWIAPKVHNNSTVFSFDNQTALDGTSGAGPNIFGSATLVSCTVIYDTD